METMDTKNEIPQESIEENKLDYEFDAEDYSEEDEADEPTDEVKQKYEYVYGELIQDAPLKEKLLANEEFDENEAMGFVRASFFCVGELKIDSKSTTSEYSFRNGLVALKFCQAIKILCSYSPEVSFVDPADKRKIRKFVVSLPEKITFDILTRLNIISVNEKTKKIERFVNKIAKFTSIEYKRGFFLLVYLECGKLSYYGDYKLNFILESETQAKKLVECFKREQFSASVLQDKPIMFIKGEAVSHFVALIGASRESVVLSDYYCKRSATRIIRRDENWKLANYDRQLTASVNQLVAIKAIRDANQFGLLSDDLKELALVREANPDMSILEVSKLLGISKSTAYHRMERIIEFSKDITRK